MSKNKQQNNKIIKDYMLSRIQKINNNSLTNIESKLDDEFIRTMNLQYKNYFKIIYNSFVELGVFDDFNNQHINPIGKKVIVSEKSKTDVINEVIDQMYGVRIGDSWESMREYNKEKYSKMVKEYRDNFSFSNKIKKYCEDEILFPFEDDINSILIK
jgi:hypothetical protein